LWPKGALLIHDRDAATGAGTLDFLEAEGAYYLGPGLEDTTSVVAVGVSVAFARNGAETGLYVSDLAGVFEAPWAL